MGVFVIFEDSAIIRAPAHAVWDFLMDVERSSACVPGVDELTIVDDRTFDGVVTARVGPIAGKFSFRASIVESDPPRQTRIEVEGVDSVTRSTLRMETTMTLSTVGADETELAHRAVVEIHGRLAILGDMVLRATASMMLAEFTKQVRLQLEGSEMSA